MKKYNNKSKATATQTIKKNFNKRGNDLKIPSMFFRKAKNSDNLLINDLLRRYSNIQSPAAIQTIRRHLNQ